MKTTKTKVAVIVGFLFLASIASNIFFYVRYKDAQNSNPDVQTQRIVSELKKTIALPNETPSVLTVVDKSKLTDSQIAKNAQNGDKILLYQKAGEVVVYRPSTRKLINILSLNTANKTAATNTQATSSDN